jgi:hydrazine synthase alpha subunit-like protein/fibronectin type III domain protein
LKKWISALVFIAIWVTSLGAAPAKQAESVALPNPILFVGQVPIPGDFTSVASTFGNHDGHQSVAPRGGDLFILYPSGTLKNITRVAGFGNSGFQGANSIAVREPCVHWSGTKALFSMVVGAPTQQFQIGTTYHWQIYEVTNLGEGQAPVVTKIANQPATYNNISPVYGTDGRILFTSDRPRSGETHLYPQLDEYEEAPTVTGIWSLNPASGDLRLLNHAPSGAFTPSIDSFGRLIFTRWDHLQRDQQADSDAEDPGTYGTFDYSDESAAAQKLNQRVEVFPEPRAGNTPPGSNLVGNNINHFFPWAMNEDGTSEETINHIGRHELHNFFARVFNDDPAITEFIYFNGVRFNTNEAENTFQLKEDPLHPGLYYATDAPEFSSHASGQIVSFSAPPTKPADQVQVNWITPRATRDFDDPPAPADHTGHYRDPLPLSDGALLAAHTAETREDTDVGTPGHPQSLYDFRIKPLTQQQNGFYTPGASITGGIQATVSYWSPDVLIQWAGTLWELSPVEVRPRSIPATATTPLEQPELNAFTQANVDVQQFRQYMIDRNLALIVSRDVTTRDKADKQQPFNLRVPGGVSHIVSQGQKPYDVSHLQLYQADQLRGLGSTPDPNNPNLVVGGKKGRRVLARTMHDSAAAAANPPATVTPQGGVTVALDGSVAAFVPARRAMSWQLNDPNHTGVVRERYWLTFQPGEVRVCASCHGINSKNQLNLPPPTNTPSALTALLQFWKGQQSSTPAAPANFSATAATTTSIQLSWTASVGATPATQYEVARATGGGPFGTIQTTAATSITDNTAVAGNAYIYKVRAIDTSTGTSAYSIPDVATTFAFTDDPLIVQSTRIKAIHFTELRQAVNALRAAAGLAAATFTDPTITTATIVKAVHEQELRTALNQARAALGMSSLTFTDAALLPGTTGIRALHLQELRNGLK